MCFCSLQEPGNKNENGRIPTERSDKQNETGIESRTRGTLMNKSEEWGKADTTYFRYERWSDLLN